MQLELEKMHFEIQFSKRFIQLSQSKYYLDAIKGIVIRLIKGVVIRLIIPYKPQSGNLGKAPLKEVKIKLGRHP